GAHARRLEAPGAAVRAHARVARRVRRGRGRDPARVRCARRFAGARSAGTAFTASRAVAHVRSARRADGGVELGDAIGGLMHRRRIASGLLGLLLGTAAHAAPPGWNFSAAAFGYIVPEDAD